MKYMIASDIHGSAFYAEKLIVRFNEEKAEKLILLGDIYYHGPRNPLPDGYSPAETSKIFNAIKDKLVVVKGNCDSEVDAMISDFPILSSYIVKSGGKIIFFTHGHRFNSKNPPSRKFDILVYGHEHIGFIRIEHDKIFANPGSVSLPKGNSVRSYLLLQNPSLTLKDLDGKTISQMPL